MFRFKQSSPKFAGTPIIADMLASCMQPRAKVSATLTPFHALTGCGTFQRRSPTGGVANGIPLNEATPSLTTPFNRPPVIFAVSIWDRAKGDIAHVITIKNPVIRIFFTFFSNVKTLLVIDLPNQTIVNAHELENGSSAWKIRCQNTLCHKAVTKILRPLLPQQLEYREDYSDARQRPELSHCRVFYDKSVLYFDRGARQIRLILGAKRLILAQEVFRTDCCYRSSNWGLMASCLDDLQLIYRAMP